MKQAARITLPACGCDATTLVFLPKGFAARDLDIVAGDTKRTLALVPGELTPVTLPASSTFAHGHIVNVACNSAGARLPGQQGHAHGGSVVPSRAIRLRDSGHRAMIQPSTLA